jgi:hypothetical protein
MYQIGDSITIEVCLPDICYHSSLVISYLTKGLLVTCGHCLPQNSNLNFGEILYTSGFDNSEEGTELGIIKIYPEVESRFNQYFNGKPVKINTKPLATNSSLLLVHNGEVTFGKVLAKQLPHDRMGAINVHDWTIDHQVDKITAPYFLVYATQPTTDPSLVNRLISEADRIFDLRLTDYPKITTCCLSQPGYSGSPWLKLQDDQYCQVGIHIAKTLGIRKEGSSVTISEIAYVKPIPPL